MIKKWGWERVRWQKSFPHGACGEGKCGRQRGQGSQPSRQSRFDWKGLFARCEAALWWNQKQTGAVWAAEASTSAHAVLGRHDFPLCRENSLVCWESFPHICGARLFSVTAILSLWSHTQHSKPAWYYNVKAEGAETVPQPTSGRMIMDEILLV